MKPQDIADFGSHRIEGFVHQTGQALCVPLFTQIDGNLWMGGAPVESLPREFVACLDLYGHADYFVRGDQLRQLSVLQDSRSQPLDRLWLEMLAEWVETCCGRGPTLVHCQAGLNRSGLITTMVLMRRGIPAADAIALLRAKRDPQVLCNPHFENFLLGRKAMGHESGGWM